MLSKLFICYHYTYYCYYLSFKVKTNGGIPDTDAFRQNLQTELDVYCVQMQLRCFQGPQGSRPTFIQTTRESERSILAH